MQQGTALSCRPADCAAEQTQRPAPPCPAGQQIVQQGWPSNHMYFIRSGLINLVMTTHDDKGSAVDTMIVSALHCSCYRLLYIMHTPAT